MSQFWKAGTYLAIFESIIVMGSIIFIQNEIRENQLIDTQNLDQKRKIGQNESTNSVLAQGWLTFATLVFWLLAFTELYDIQMRKICCESPSEEVDEELDDIH